MEAAGIEPETFCDVTVYEETGCDSAQQAGAANALQTGGIDCHESAAIDVDWHAVMDLLPGLPESIQRAIVAITHSFSPVDEADQVPMATGFQDRCTCDATAFQGNELRHDSEHSGLTSGIRLDCGIQRSILTATAGEQGGAEFDGDLLRVVSAWPILAEPLKAAVIAIIATVASQTASDVASTGDRQ